MKLNLIAVALLVSAWPGASFAMPPEQPEQLIHAGPRVDAEASLRRMLQGRESRRQVAATLGLANEAELAVLRVGRGMQMDYLDASALGKGRGVGSSTLHTDTWRFVLWVGDTPVGLATAERTADGSYDVVDVGARQLATRIESTLALHPVGTSSRLLRSQEAMMDVITLDYPAPVGLRYATLMPVPVTAIATSDSKASPSLLADGELAAMLRTVTASRSN